MKEGRIMSRRPVIAGNWKMHNLQQEAIDLTNGLMQELKDEDKAALPEVVIAPTFTSLYVANKALKDCGCGKVKLAAQNCYELSGTESFTIQLTEDGHVSSVHFMADWFDAVLTVTKIGSATMPFNIDELPTL